MISADELIQKYQAYSSQSGSELIRKAYLFSQDAHKVQQRANQEPYFTHCLSVTELLVDFKMDHATIAAGLLHDVLEDTHVTLDELKKEFGDEVANLVDGVTKLDKLRFSSSDEFQAENWRKMLLAMAKDIRVILIKLADRLHNMRTLSFLPVEDQKRIAQETVSLYAPIADRLGMFAIKSELEDLCLKTLNREEYRQIAKGLEEKISEREKYVEKMVKALDENLKKLNIACRVTGRPKHIYSIYKKMERQQKSLPQIEDTIGLRIITDTVPNCYALLGEVHEQFKPIPDTFTDYIAHPKVNMYQSLHTTVQGPENKRVEIQIRTEEMHRRAEFGIAAHWKYKLGGGASPRDKQLETNLNWLREWLEWLQDLNNPGEFMESLKTELKVYQVFVFTPKNEVKALPEGATPVDFAYAVHTDIGNSCMGALVNKKMVKLDYELKSGDVCQILTRKSSKPNEDWLVFVKTAKARSRIRRALKDIK